MPSPSKYEGRRVVTAEKLDRRDYTEEGVARRKPGVSGTILSESNSHGLCYEVKHVDGSRAFYDPDELSWVGDLVGG